MKFRLYYIGAITGLAVTTPAAAQTGGYPQTQPYGMTAGETSQPYTPPARDENGNRIVINGQVIGSGQSANPARSPGSLATRSGTTLPSGGTLSGGGITAVSIGNSVNISDTYASTIIINQTNNGSQTVNLNGTPESDED